MGSDPEKLFPYKMMLEHLRKYARHALILASLLLPWLSTENKNDKDFVRIENQNADRKGNGTNGEEETHLESKMDKRLRDIVADMIRLKYIEP